MRKANNYETAMFKRKYCKSDKTRIQMRQDFSVVVESHEEVMPGSIVNSFATGERRIDGEFVLFTVKDQEKGIMYYPIFSVETARTMLNAWDIRMPPKRSILRDVNEGGTGGGGNGHTTHNANNKKLRLLILFARSLIVHHVEHPEPMYGPLKIIYERLEEHPEWEVCSRDILQVNDMIKKYINGTTNKRNENYQDLQEYIVFLQNNIGNRQLRDVDFNVLGQILKRKYPNEQIYF